MIFVGDISLPYPGAIKMGDLPDELIGKRWFANFEGAVIDNSEEHKNNWIVYNDKRAIKALAQQFDFSGFALANNHILDSGSYRNTVEFLHDIGIPFLGIGENKAHSAIPMSLFEEDQNIVILNFGWEVIQCEIASKTKLGVNPLTKKHAIETFLNVKSAQPHAKIIVFFHWNYELEAYPQPRERELARFLIDNGAAGIIGCHPHRIGGFELYKDKPIVYSLGNWMFLQNFYHKGKIRFPSFCNDELAFEWNLKTDEFKFHFFEYDKENSLIKYMHSEGVESSVMIRYTPFRDMSDKQYREWYKENRYHKGKGLPIYYWEDDNVSVNIKNMINKLRDQLIYWVVKMGVK